MLLLKKTIESRLFVSSYSMMIWQSPSTVHFFNLKFFSYEISLMGSNYWGKIQRILLALSNFRILLLFFFFWLNDPSQLKDSFSMQRLLWFSWIILCHSCLHGIHSQLWGSHPTDRTKDTNLVKDEVEGILSCKVVINGLALGGDTQEKFLCQRLCKPKNDLRLDDFNYHVKIHHLDLIKERS